MRRANETPSKNNVYSTNYNVVNADNSTGKNYS